MVRLAVALFELASRELKPRTRQIDEAFVKDAGLFVDIQVRARAPQPGLRIFENDGALGCGRGGPTIHLQTIGGQHRFALGDDDLVRIVARVEALSDFLVTEDGANLLAGYKRAANILGAEAKKGALPTGEARERAGAPAEELALIRAVKGVSGAVDTALAKEDFEAAMTALAGLRAPVDAFFEAVLVNSDDPEERANRLRLLVQVRDAMGQVADFSQVSG